MTKALILASLSLYHYANGKKIEGDCSGLYGDCSGLYGDCSGLSGDCSSLSGDCSRLYGDCSRLSGDCSGLYGNCSGLYGDFDDCELSETDRNNGISVSDMVKKQENTK